LDDNQYTARIRRRRLVPSQRCALAARARSTPIRAGRLKGAAERIVRQGEQQHGEVDANIRTRRTSSGTNVQPGFQRCEADANTADGRGQRCFVTAGEPAGRGSA
jgi:hypothetical protein